MVEVLARDLEMNKRTDAFFGEGFEKELEEVGDDLVVGEFTWEKKK